MLRLARWGRFVILVHVIGEAQQVMLGIVQGDVQVFHRHQLAQDAVDRLKQLIQAGGGDYGVRNAVDGLLDLLAALAGGDVHHHALPE